MVTRFSFNCKDCKYLRHGNECWNEAAVELDRWFQLYPTADAPFTLLEGEPEDECPFFERRGEK